jgi:ATP-dependent HslUV protease subunit HslV
MTTIAYRDGMLAADTLITCGDSRDGFAAKIVKVDGMLCGASGSAIHGQAFVAWLKKGREGDCPLLGLGEKDRTNGIMVSPDGKLRMWSDTGFWDFEPHGGYYAIGSGCEYATGAMAMGATAEQAVRVAIKHDVRSGGDVTVLRLDE